MQPKEISATITEQVCACSLFRIETKRPKGGVHMKKYEIMYIVNASLDDDQFQKVTDRLNNTITENGGTIDSFDDWGIKEFAY